MEFGCHQRVGWVGCEGCDGKSADVGGGGQLEDEYCWNFARDDEARDAAGDSEVCGEEGLVDVFDAARDEGETETDS